MKKIFTFLFLLLVSFSLISCSEYEDILNDLDIPTDSNSSEEQCEVKFILEGITISTVKVNSGSTVEKPSDPTKDGYTFLGWYINDLKWDFTYSVTTDMTLVAKFEEIDESNLEIYTENSISLSANQTCQIEVTSNKNYFDKSLLTYSSSNENILTVNSDGLIRVVAVPVTDITVTITVRYKEVSTTINVLVKSLIESLTAKNKEVAMKVDEALLITNYYILKGNGSLSSKQKACTYNSSNKNIVNIDGKKMKAISTGKATITVTSEIDPTKTCTFDVIVTDTFIDRNLTIIPSNDDFDNEVNVEGVSSFTTSGISTDYYVKGINGTQWYAEVTISLREVSASELYPKFGIMTSTVANNPSTVSMVYFYLDAAIGTSGNSIWRNFGFCEVANGGLWAWNAGVNDMVARHRDDAFVSSIQYTYATEFKLAVARNGMDFHVFVNDQYAYSFTTLDSLFKDNAGNVVASHVGFFHINSSVTFSKYSVTDDSTSVVARIPSQLNWITSFTMDAN